MKIDIAPALNCTQNFNIKHVDLKVEISSWLRKVEGEVRFAPSWPHPRTLVAEASEMRNVGNGYSNKYDCYPDKTCT